MITVADSMPPSQEASTFAFGTVVLAAGRSRRMGRPKLLLPWAASSVLGHLLVQWQELGAAQIVVVAAAEDRAIEDECLRLSFPIRQLIFNPSPERGMFSSVQCAARWKDWRGELTHWAIVLGDQPHLRQQTLRQVLALCVANPDQICQPAYGDHRRHPVLIPRSVFNQLAGSSALDLKAFLATMPERIVSCSLDDPGLDLDIDHPADYEKALELARSII
jgi:molybdenum cofactor cytidylyltransferase